MSADSQPAKRGRKPGKGKGGIKEGSSGGFRCRVNINCKQVFGPTRRTRAEAEADLRIASDNSIPAEERLAALKSPRAHKPKNVTPSDQAHEPGPALDTTDGASPLVRQTVHCLDAPTIGEGLARCGSDQSRPLLVTGVVSKITCIGCLRLLVDDRLSGMAARASMLGPNALERTRS